MWRWGMMWLVVGLIVCGCSGGGGGGNGGSTTSAVPPGVTSTSTPPDPSPPPAQPPPAQQTPMLGLYHGTWVSTTTPTVGGSADFEVAPAGVHDTTHALFGSSPCYTTGVLQIRQDGAQVSGQVLWTTGGVSSVTGTVSADGTTIMATYQVSTTTTRCPADAGTLTLVQVRAGGSVFYPIGLTPTTFPALVGHTFHMTPGVVLQAVSPDAVDLVFPTTEIVTATTPRGSQQGGVGTIAPQDFHFGFNPGPLWPTGITLAFTHAALVVLPARMIVGGLAATASAQLYLTNAATGGDVRSTPVTVPCRLASDGTVFLSDEAGREVPTLANVFRAPPAL